MIVNYRASVKTRAPFCGISCCGTHFGRCERGAFANIHHNNFKRAMRRYAKHADNLLVKKEIAMELTGNYDDWDIVDETPDPERVDVGEDDYADMQQFHEDRYKRMDDYSESERIDSHDIEEEQDQYEQWRQEDALDQEQDIIEGEMRDEYFREIELED